MFEWPSDGIIRVNGLKNKVLKARIPSLGDQKITFIQKGLLLHVQGPVREPGADDSVVELEVEGEVQAENGSVVKLISEVFRWDRRKQF